MKSRIPSTKTLKFAGGLLALATICCLFCLCVGPADVPWLLGTQALAVGLVFRKLRCLTDWFDRAQAYSTTPGFNGWTIKDTSAGGTPTYLNTADGAVLTLANTSEAEVVTLYQNDVLTLPLWKLQLVRFLVQVAGVDAVTTLVVGLASAQNDTADSVAVNAWFRMEGSASTSAIVVETDDGTTDNNDKATGKTLAAVAKELTVDFTHGLTDVRFYIDGERVAAGTTFDMSAASATQNVQPFVQIQKASGTGVPAVTVRLAEIQYQFAQGA